MKHLFAVTISILLFTACKKNKNAILIDDATITILHNTCVKTIIRVDVPNTTIGITWNDSFSANPVVYQYVIQTGEMKHLPSTGLQVQGVYKVKIFEKATGPQSNL